MGAELSLYLSLPGVPETSKFMRAFTPGPATLLGFTRKIIVIKKNRWYN